MKTKPTNRKLPVAFPDGATNHETAITFWVGNDEAKFARTFIAFFAPENARRRAEFRAGLAALVWNEAKKDLQIVDAKFLTANLR